MEKTQKLDKVAKALEALQAIGEKIEKGHTSGSTVTTKVESFVGESGATQLYHTPSNSEPSSWAGSSKQGVSQEDNIDANGTDYNGGGSVRKSVLDLVAKGKISSEEAEKLLKAFDKVEAKKDEPDGDEGYEEDDKKKKEKPEFAKGKKVAKSFEEDVKASDEFVSIDGALDKFVEGVSKSLASLEETVATVVAKVDALATFQNSFSKSLATSVSSLAEAQLATFGRVEQVEQAPARGPKSIQSSQVIEKSIQPRNYTKTQVADGLFELVKKGEATDLDVSKFEMSGQITKSLEAKVFAHLEGK